MAIDETRKADFEKFFNHEAIAIADMDYATLVSHIQDLEKIAFEAKARLSAGHGKKRKFEYDMSKDERDRLISQPSLSVSESLQTVAKRADRMTKADKFMESMKKLGLDEEALKAIADHVTPNKTTNATLTFKSDNPEKNLLTLDGHTDANENKTSEPKQNWNPFAK